MKIPWWAWAIWVVTGALMELLAILTAERGDTLTEYTVGAGLAWIAAGFGLWLAVHFGRRIKRWWEEEER